MRFHRIQSDEESARTLGVLTSICANNRSMRIIQRTLFCIPGTVMVAAVKNLLEGIAAVFKAPQAAVRTPAGHLGAQGALQQLELSLKGTWCLRVGLTLPPPTRKVLSTYSSGWVSAF